MKPAELRRFTQLVDEFLSGLGAQQSEDTYQYTIATRAGLLKLRIDDKVDNVYSVFGRFDNPDFAKRVVDCNPCSGKWNFHTGQGWPVHSAVDQFKERIRSIT